MECLHVAGAAGSLTRGNFKDSCSNYNSNSWVPRIASQKVAQHLKHLEPIQVIKHLWSIHAKRAATTTIDYKLQSCLSEEVQNTHTWHTHTIESLPQPLHMTLLCKSVIYLARDVSSCSTSNKGKIILFTTALCHYVHYQRIKVLIPSPSWHDWGSHWPHLLKGQNCVLAVGNRHSDLPIPSQPL